MRRKPVLLDADRDYAAADNGRPAAFHRVVLRTLLRALGDPPVRFVLWNGEEVAISRERPVARLLVRDARAVLRLAANPERNFGDLYAAGRIEVLGDMAGFLATVYRRARDYRPNGTLERLVRQTHRRRRPNTLARSSDNVHHHYDIGNDFYRLWLDERMAYTCAYFQRPDTDLESAQLAKMDHVCRKLRLRPGETVVEAGCGWGALARHMARHFGVRVRAYNVSGEQVRDAREQARAEGFGSEVEFVQADYRAIEGRYDAFVSVGMLEHVGPENYRALADVIHRCLKESGRGLIHTIGRTRAMPMNAWIERRIFPGAHPPSLAELMQVFEPWDFSVLDVENLRLHYARTLEHWLTRFETHVETIERMFDAPFARAWRLYLAGSMAAFQTAELHLFQVLFAPRGNDDVPWTRAYLYTEHGNA